MIYPLKNIIKFAREIHIIDQYCKSYPSNWDSYKEFISLILVILRDSDSPLKIINIYVSCPKDLKAEDEKSNYERWLKEILNNEEEVKIHYLKQKTEGESMHLRGIFTDSVLVTSHYGFGAGSSQAETTDLVVQDHKVFKKIKTDYSSDANRAFDLVHVTTIRS